MKIAFATLGCPNWTLEQVAGNAKSMGFDGVELRGVKGEHIGPDETPADCARIRKLFEAKGLGISAIMGYSTFTHDDPAKREESIAAAIRFLDIAHHVGCPVLRVFGGMHSKELDLQGNIERVAQGLRKVAPYAERRGVKLALETHDDWCKGENLAAVQKAVASPALGFCWDVCNSFFVEPLEKTCASMQGRIYHVHFKDGAAGANGHVVSKLPGEGSVDLRKALALLRQSGYDGYLSFEWEKKWQPDLAEPEVAFPHYVRFARSLLKEQARSCQYLPGHGGRAAAPRREATNAGGGSGYGHTGANRMIIDMHAHVYAWPKVRARPDSTPLLSAAEQIGIMDKLGVEKAVILPLASPVPGADPQSIGEVLHICAQYPGRFIPFCCLEPRIGKRPEHIVPEDYLYRLEQYRDLGCKGVGEMTVRIPFDDPCLLAFFTACERIGFPVTFHTTTFDCDTYGLLDDVGLPRFERVLQLFPKLVFLGHSPGFWGEISGGATSEEKETYAGGPVKPGGRLPELFRRYPNLYGDISARSGLNALSRDPAHAAKFIEEFQDRLVMGLDYCSTRNDMQHIAWLRAQRDAGFVSAAVCDKILGGNAVRLLGL